MSPLPSMARWVSDGLAEQVGEDSGGAFHPADQWWIGRGTAASVPGPFLLNSPPAAEVCCRLAASQWSPSDPNVTAFSPVWHPCIRWADAASTTGIIKHKPTQGNRTSPSSEVRRSDRSRVRARLALGALPWHDAPEMIVCTVDCQKILHGVIQHTTFYFSKCCVANNSQAYQQTVGKFYIPILCS